MGVSDESLREFERKWLESSDPADEAAWLLARLRAGELDHGRLRLAAYLGSEGSALALGDLVPRVPEGLIDWVQGLAPGQLRYTAWARGDRDQPWAKQVLVRVAAAALWITLPLWDVAEPDDDRPGRVLEASLVWAEEPTPEHVEAVIDVLGVELGPDVDEPVSAEILQALGLGAGLEPLPGDPEELNELSQVVEELSDEERTQLLDPLAALMMSAGFGASLETDDPKAQQVAVVAGLLAAAIRQPFQEGTTALIATAVGQAAKATSEEAVRKAVAKHVAAWALKT